MEEAVSLCIILRIAVALMLLAIACSSAERPKVASSTADDGAGAMVADASEPPAFSGVSIT